MSLTSMLTQTVYLASFVSLNEYGKHTYGSPRAVKARVEGQQRNVRSQAGDEVISSHVVYLAEEVLPTDRIWLPGADSTSAEASNVPLTITSSPRPTGGVTLWKVEL